MTMKHAAFAILFIIVSMASIISMVLFIKALIDKDKRKQSLYAGIVLAGSGFNCLKSFTKESIIIALVFFFISGIMISSCIWLGKKEYLLDEQE